MLIENQEFNAKLGAPPLTGDGVFRLCTFEGIDLDGAGFTGVLEGCRLQRSQFYWGLFNTASLIDTHFVACVFPGTSFRGCRLVNCAFADCRFVLDNLGCSASIDDCSIHGMQLRTLPLPARPSRRTRSRRRQ